MNVFMYLLVLIIGKSKVLFVLRECAVFEFKSGNSAAKFVIWIFNDFYTETSYHTQPDVSLQAFQDLIIDSEIASL